MAFRPDFSYFKSHPYITGAVVIIGGVVFYYIALRPSGGDATGTSVAVYGGGQTTDPTLARAQQEQQFQLSYLQEQTAGQLALTGLQGQISTTQQAQAIVGQQNIQGQQLQAQLAIAALQHEEVLTLAEINAATQLQSQAIAANTALQITGMQTAANISLASIQSDLQKAIASYQTQAVIGTAQASAQALTAVAKYQAKSDIFGSILGLAGSFL